ncbi:Retrovirus-related Pol polyprotein from transposon TNT 1-94 [Araneus ventricosus]|uniref:Retrovirus-related Pol polyprotein from transposon TNT 1-94 n=1 Tax=Araneus ventricosus TaxID=182803 RepID=A0A4Y2M4Q2_ARAVE|nr:Retrovirus-related Pol polyprotein from transposon TNT 1-94 [Araneus ventricosus]GBN22048.1 Retrovirus-related Pol polyprotein from transposon TNT 1-94 [Araneus ventricosus]
MAFAESCNFEKLNNNNYKQWKFNIKMQLLNLGLIEFVNKQEPVLDAEATKADKQNFELRKAKALSTICLNDVNFTSLNIQKSLLAEYDRVTVREKSEARPKEPAVFSIESAVSRKKNSTKEFKERRKCFICGTVGHIRKNCWKFKNANKMPTHQQRKPPTFMQDELSNPAVFYASAYCTQSMDIEFVIDSAATEHFVNDINLFTNFQKLSSSASMAEGTTNILGKGDVSLEIMDNSGKVSLLLKNVLYAPQMVRNLISLRKFDLAHYSILVKNFKMIIRTPRNRLFLTVPLIDKFYVIKANVIKMQNDSAAYISDKDGIELWHARFGHLNMQGLKDFSKSNNVYGLENLKGNVDKCDTCCLTKSSRASLPNIDKIRTQHVLELVHMDIWGPAPVKSLGGAEYFYSIIDDYSRYAVVYFLKHKNEAFECFKAYKQAMERLTNRKIKRVRSDNGTEFSADYFEQYLINEGIKIERTNTYSPEMNGVAERYNRTIIEGVRALLHESKLPKTLWAELVNTQNYLRNRFPHKSLKGKAPLNVWSDKKFSVRHFKRIGCVAYVFIPKRYRNKLEPNAQKGIMMGYALNTLGYRIFFPQSGKITETKHVKFNESILGVDSNVQMKDNKFRMVDSFSDFELSSNKTPMPELSDKTECEWKRVCVTRQKGKSKGRIDVYYYPESKVRLRSKHEVKKYCESKGIDYNPDNFDFSPKLILDDNKPNAIETQSDDFSTDIEDISDSEAHLVDIKIPNNFKESQMVPERENWCNAMKEELEILKVRDVYEIVPRPKNKNVLGNKWVYTLKKDVTGKIKRYRARLVAQGFRQIEGIDYFDTFSPVINFTLVRLFIVILVTMKGWFCNHLDIKSAYLYAPLNEDIFMEQPSGFVIDNEYNSVFKLKKALYGLKQAGREWYSELNNTLIELGFQKLLTSNCIYVYKSFVLLLVYVDDIAIFACNEQYMNEAIGLIKSKFDVKDLGKLSKFLGVEFEMRNGNFIMHQKSYINKMRNIFGNIPNCKSLVPLSPGIAIYDNKEHDVLNVPYRNLIGSLSFLASRTRPDIMFAVNFLSQFNNNPSITHWNLICQVFHYVLNTSNYEINLSKSESFALTAYTDASWAADNMDRKSISGYVIFLGDVPVSWSTSKQKCTALSSMEAEYIALSEAVKEIVWLNRIMNSCLFLELPVIKSKIFCDNQSAICYSKNLMENQRTKHIDTRYFFVKEKLNAEEFDLLYVSGKKNVADIMTKALSYDKLKFYCNWLFCNVSE